MDIRERGGTLAVRSWINSLAGIETISRKVRIDKDAETELVFESKNSNDEFFADLIPIPHGP
jgi:hypothetical protein